MHNIIGYVYAVFCVFFFFFAYLSLIKDYRTIGRSTVAGV